MSTVMPTKAEELADPFPFFAKLRETDPVAWDDVHEMWLVSTYDEAQEVLSNPQTFSSHAGHMSELGAPLILTEDPPSHTRLRRMVSRVFTPRRIADMEPRVQEVTSDLIDTMKVARDEGRSVDLVQGLSAPLPVVIIAEIIGISPEDRERIWTWSYDFLASMEKGEGWRDAITPTLEQLREYFHRVIEARRESPRDDLISALLEGTPDGDRLSEEELFMMCEILMVAGNETTSNLISNAVDAMIRFPDQYARLREDPDLVTGWVEETLRWNPSVRAPNDRRAMTDTVLGGKHIRAGDKLLVLTPSANRDASVFDRPDEFIPDRHPNRHMAFGYGVHFCLGAPLARLETRTALRAFIEAFPEFSYDPEDPPVKEDLMHTCGFRYMPLKLG